MYMYMRMHKQQGIQMCTSSVYQVHITPTPRHPHTTTYRPSVRCSLRSVSQKRATHLRSPSIHDTPLYRLRFPPRRAPPLPLGLPPSWPRPSCACRAPDFWCTCVSAPVCCKSTGSSSHPSATATAAAARPAAAAVSSQAVFGSAQGPLVESEGPLVKSEGPLVESEGPLVESQGPLCTPLNALARLCSGPGETAVSSRVSGTCRGGPRWGWWVWVGCVRVVVAVCGCAVRACGCMGVCALVH